MKKTAGLLGLSGLLLLSANTFSQDTNRFVFLCFGQSNMEGFPGLLEEDKGPVDERFQCWPPWISRARFAPKAIGIPPCRR
jgi:hypothetical protein